MSLNIFEASLPFVNSAAGKQTFVAAADLNRLRQNALFLDMLSARGRSAWTDTLIPSELYGGTPFLITAAGFQYRVGMTTASFQIYSIIPGGTHTARVRFNTVQVATAVLTGGVGGGTQTINVTISGMGFTDYQIIDVEVDVAVVGSSVAATYRVLDAYVAPLGSGGVYTAAYPGGPTFGTVSAANLNQLIDAQQWCMDRLSLAGQPALMTTMIYSLHGYVSTKLAWSGSAVRENGATRLRVAVGLQVVTNQAEFLRLYVFGSMNTSFDSTTFAALPSQQLYLFDIDISSQTIDVPFAISLEQRVTTAGATSQQATRITIYHVETTAASPAAVTIPALMAPRESMTYTTLQTRLNQIADATDTAAARIAAAFDIFNRVRMFRWRPGLDEGQRKTFQDVFVGALYRKTDAIWVRGKNVKMGYGARVIDRVVNDPWTQTYQYFEDLISGDEVQDKLIYLDSFEGLFPGVEMFFLGDDVRYVAESWG